ncbi:hypothetical protein STENM327S_02322 [Streptomyces tendae]
MVAGTPPTGERTARRRVLLHSIAVHSLGVAAALFFALPFVFVVLTSLMSDQQALHRAATCGRTWEWGNYRAVLGPPASSPGGRTRCCTRGSAPC